MQKGDLHICALTFLAPSYCCLPPFPESQSSKTLICSGSQLLLQPVECPCPQNYRNKPPVQPCPILLWALVQLLDTFMCHINTLQRRAGKNLPHQDMVLVLLWVCCVQQGQLLTKQQKWQSGCSAEPLIPVLGWCTWDGCFWTDNKLLLSPHCIHEDSWLCCALKHYRGMSHWASSATS